MNERVTNAVTRCLEIDVDFYRELLVFLMKKHAKIMTDDLSGSRSRSIRSRHIS